MIVKAGFGDLPTVEKMTAAQVLDILEFMNIQSDIEHYEMEQARNG